ncbi:MAG TPA: hypothetical protein VFX49_02075 [Chloroflexota bacterium]|nr:hypothetical protein [Chloroflexota bacterium]
MTSIRWLGTRAVVGVAAFGSVLVLAQLTVSLLVAAYANVAPYAGS